MSFALFQNDEKQEPGKAATAGDFLLTVEGLSALAPDRLSNTVLDAHVFTRAASPALEAFPAPPPIPRRLRPKSRLPRALAIQ